ncbi:MAG: BCCT family transporter [Defluviitaleaceae bacterium]|nr:BCCT family transporter [Defluviitaleaceae bacterium]
MKVDKISMIVPLILMLTLGTIFIVIPEQSELLLGTIRAFLGDSIGIYYIILGVFILGVTLYMAFSRYGKIRLGSTEDGKPAYSNFAWGAMIFTSTMAADIIFFSLSEWAMYATEPRLADLGDTHLWAATFPLFHWGPIAWSFYIVLAVSLGFMLHVRGRTKKKFSEACRPIIGARTDGILGKIIDLFAIFALLAGTATTFSLATPLIAAAVARITNIEATVVITIVILLVVALVCAIAVLAGMKGISKLANIVVYIFFALLLYFLFLGGETRFILEMGVASLGNLAQNFVSMATWTDPLRENEFPQNWTIFYWAYWMAWCVATPFFIGMISKGRTIKNTVLGGYFWGLAGTFSSFIILGNYGLAQQARHGVDTAAAIYAGVDISYAIIGIFETLPLPTLAILLLAVTMIMFYATTFDALTMVVSNYSYQELKGNEEPSRKVRVFWLLLFIVFPIGLIFSESALNNLQSVAIIAAFPIGIIVLVIVAGFFRDAGQSLKTVGAAHTRQGAALDPQGTSPLDPVKF